MPDLLPRPLRWLLMVLPFALWGTAMAAMKPLLDGAPVFSLAALRVLPAGVVLLLALLSFNALAIYLRTRLQKPLS